MKKIFIIFASLLIILTICTHGQEVYPNKRYVANCIKNIKREFKKPFIEREQLFQLFCQNDDSIFYKSDTVRFYSSESLFNKFHRKDKTLIFWDFCSKNKLVKGGYYRGSSMGWTILLQKKQSKVLKVKSIRPKYKFTSKNNRTILIVKNHFEPNEFYCILRIEKKDEGYIIDMIKY